MKQKCPLEQLGDPLLPQPLTTFQACCLLGSITLSTSNSRELLHNEHLTAPRRRSIYPRCRQVAEAAARAHILELTTLQPHQAPFPWAETTPSQPEELRQTKGEAAPETKSYASLIIEGLPAPPSPPSPRLTSSCTKRELT